MSFLNFLFRGPINTEAIKVLNVEEYKKAISNNNIQLVDVRTSQEFASEHIRGAQNVDYFQQSKFKATFSKMDRDKPVYLYCQSGNRSQKAARKLVDMGFGSVYDLRGGYNKWKY
ncbi:rhodanese-like domain-containing protein [Allomuricauda sp. R78024]|uniref:rhodanese-like domain-containing protein n=1 Tax=Allomuricauda sp. R78024 TaxID=3093867 RepID=UPI0037CB4A5B